MVRIGDQPTEVLDVQIDHINHKGLGVAHYIHIPDRGSNGKKLTLFIRNVVPGDIVRVTVENAKGRKTAHLNYDELLVAGPSRRLDIANDETISGGMPLLYMQYPAQLDYKTNLIKAYLQEEDFDTSVVQPIIGMENQDRYRNKMEFTFGPNGELGMHEQGNYRNIIDLKDSLIAPKVMVEIKHAISQWQKDHNLTGYLKDTHTGLLRKLIIRKSFSTGEIMVVVFATEGLENLREATDDLVARINQQFPQVASLQWVVYTDISDGIIADESFVLSGRDYINDKLNGFTYRIWGDTFFQANPVQAEQMVKYALEMAEVEEDMSVLDLCCGIGTFSLPFAQKSKELVGIEIVENSIQAARQNAQDNGLENTTFFASDARKGLEELKKTWPTPDLLLLNPPRQGAGGKLMRSVGRYGSPKIVYISCNPKTLAEDLKWLKDFGYELKKVQPIDQFPHTIHVECVVLIEKVK